MLLRKLLGTHIVIIKSLKDPYDIQFGVYRTRWHKAPSNVYQIDYVQEPGEARIHPDKVIEALVEEIPYPVKVMYYDG